MRPLLARIGISPKVLISPRSYGLSLLPTPGALLPSLRLTLLNTGLYLSARSIEPSFFLGETFYKLFDWNSL